MANVIPVYRGRYNVRDVHHDDCCFAVALVLDIADPELVIPRHRRILELLAFPKQLRHPLNERLRFHLMEWPGLWAEWVQCGQQTMSRRESTIADSRHAHRLIRAMGRHVDKAKADIQARNAKVPESEREVMDWLQAELVEIAGRMRLKKRISTSPSLWLVLCFLISARKESRTPAS